MRIPHVTVWVVTLWSMVVLQEAAGQPKPTPEERELIQGVRQKILNGNSSVIPEIRKWMKTEKLVAPEFSASGKLWIATNGIGLFGLEEEVPVLVKLYEHPQVNRRFRNHVLEAITRINPKAAIPFYQRELNSQRTTRANGRLLARALIRHNQQAGRDYLWKQCQEELQDPLPEGISSDRPACQFLRQLNDEQLLGKLKAAAPTLKVAATRQLVERMIARMEVNRLPVADWEELLGREAWATDKNRRVDATEALGREGTVKHLEFLEKLPDSKLKKFPRVATAVRSAKIQLRQRHWKVLAQNQTP